MKEGKAPIEDLTKTEIRILDFLIKVGKARFTDIKEGVGIPDKTVYKLMPKLIERGLAEKSGDLYQMTEKTVDVIWSDKGGKILLERDVQEASYIPSQTMWRCSVPMPKDFHPSRVRMATNPPLKGNLEPNYVVEPLLEAVKSMLEGKDSNQRELMREKVRENGKLTVSLTLDFPASVLSPDEKKSAQLDERKDEAD